MWNDGTLSRVFTETCSLNLTLLLTNEVNLFIQRQPPLEKIQCLNLDQSLFYSKES